jgi:hypothetical protein
MVIDTSRWRWVAKEWRKVWQLAHLSMPVARTARVTARCTFVHGSDAGPRPSRSSTASVRGKPIASASRVTRKGTFGRWRPEARHGRTSRPGPPGAAQPRVRAVRSVPHSHSREAWSCGHASISGRGTRRTSSTVSTTGRHCGRCARTRSCSYGNGSSRTALYRNSSALNAWSLRRGADLAVHGEAGQVGIDLFPAHRETQEIHCL